MKFLLQTFTAFTLFLNGTINCAAVNAYTLIHPDTQQQVVIFGDYHYSHCFLSKEERDEYVTSMIKTLLMLERNSYELFYEPTQYSDQLYMEKGVGTRDENTLNSILYRVGYMLEHTQLAYLAHDIHRAGIVGSLLSISSPEIQKILGDSLSKDIHNRCFNYLAIAVPMCLQQFTELKNIKHLPQYTGCLTALTSLCTALEDKTGSALQAWLAHDRFESFVHTTAIAMNVADLTTLDYILDSSNSAAIYVGSAHAANLRHLLETFGYTTPYQINFGTITGNIVSGKFSFNSTKNLSLVKQTFFAILEYKDSQRLRAINLLARLISQEKKISEFLSILTQEQRENIGTETITTVEFIASICTCYHKIFTERLIKINPEILISNPSRAQTEAEEDFVVRLIDGFKKDGMLQGLQSELIQALDNVELVYDTVPGLNN